MPLHDDDALLCIKENEKLKRIEENLKRWIKLLKESGNDTKGQVLDEMQIALKKIEEKKEVKK